MGSILRFALCCMVCLVGRCIELRLLTLQGLCFLAGTSVDLLNVVEQRQDSEKGRLKPSNVHDIGPIHCFLVGCFPTMQGHRPGQANCLALAEAIRVFLCKLFLHCAKP